jgi:hypothetical protein
VLVQMKTSPSRFPPHPFPSSPSTPVPHSEALSCRERIKEVHA